MCRTLNLSLHLARTTAAARCGRYLSLFFLGQSDCARSVHIALNVLNGNLLSRRKVALTAQGLRGITEELATEEREVTVAGKTIALDNASEWQR